MTTISDVIFKLRAAIRQRGDDSGLSNRLLYSFVKGSRNAYIKQEVDKKRLYKSMEFQPLKCVEMEPSSLEACCGISVDSPLWRSKIQIPDIIDNNTGLSLQGIYTLDGSRRIHNGTLNDIQRKLNLPYSSTSMFCFFDNNYLYGYGEDFPEAVRMTAIFENPEDVYGLNQCGNGTGRCGDGPPPLCVNYLLAPFPFPGYLEKIIIADAVEEILGTYFKTTPDLSNDSEEN